MDQVGTHGGALDVSPDISCPPEMFIPIGEEIPDAYTVFSTFNADGGNATDNCGLDINSFSIHLTDTVKGELVDSITITYQIADMFESSRSILSFLKLLN